MRTVFVWVTILCLVVYRAQPPPDFPCPYQNIKIAALHRPQPQPNKKSSKVRQTTNLGKNTTRTACKLVTGTLSKTAANQYSSSIQGVFSPTASFSYHFMTSILIILIKERFSPPFLGTQWKINKWAKIFFCECDHISEGLFVMLNIYKSLGEIPV